MGGLKFLDFGKDGEGCLIPLAGHARPHPLLAVSIISVRHLLVSLLRHFAIQMNPMN